MIVLQNLTVSLLFFHIYSYVPVCVLTTGDDIESTAEPAVVISTEFDSEIDSNQSKIMSGGSHLMPTSPADVEKDQIVQSDINNISQNHQTGALFRRVTSNRSLQVTSNMSHSEYNGSSRNIGLQATKSSRRAGLSSVRNSTFSASVLFQGASHQAKNL